KLQLNMSESLIPWSQGDEFKKAMKFKRPMKDAIRGQLEENRKMLVQTYLKAEKMKRCIIGDTKETCNIEDVLEMDQYTPPTNSSVKVIKTKDPKIRDQYIVANIDTDAQQCLFDGRVDQVKTSSVINEAIIQAGLTVATLGLGSVASLGRVLTSRAVMTEKMVQNLVRGADITRLGTDGAVFLQDSKKAIEICQKYAVAEAKESPRDACQVDSILYNSKPSENYTNCMLAITFAGISGKRLSIGQLRSSLASKNVKLLDQESQTKLSKFLAEYENNPTGKSVLNLASELDNTSRFKVVESILNKNLNLSQRKAILKAHNVGGEKGYYEYSKAELRQKMKILTDSGLSKEDASKILRLGIAGKFSAQEAKLARMGLLDDQLKERNTIENLSSYGDDFRHQVSRGEDFDSRLTQNSKETSKVELALKKKNISLEEKEVLERKIKELEQQKRTLMDEYNQDKTLEDLIGVTRRRIAEVSDRVESVRSDFYRKTGNSLDVKNNSLKYRLDTRRELFESEAFLNLQKNSGNPAGSIEYFRRAVKDMNEVQSMGFVPRGQLELQRNVQLRAIAQDLKGITGSEAEELIKNKEVSSLVLGRPILTGTFNPTKTIPTTYGVGESALWKAYVNLAQRKADHAIVSELFEHSGNLKKYGIDQTTAHKIQDAYWSQFERADNELRNLIDSTYKTSNKSKDEVISALLDW
ncbi:MAG: hypothetical protein KDD45_09080, partial [Bdellovibrionales bacterium]|nr:hypothetical protein [Bdellovibrionales bacterium]